jgi:regulatory protein
MRDEPKTPTRTAYASALRRLSRRDHSEHELREALRNEGQTDEDVDDALARVKSARYLDDETYAERYTRSRLQGQGQGRMKIRQGLRTRGVAGELVERALGQAAAEGMERDALDAAARSYWRTHPRVEPAVRIRRLFVFLMRRGFPAGLVHERLRVLWPKPGAELEELDVVDQADEDIGNT